MRLEEALTWADSISRGSVLVSHYPTEPRAEWFRAAGRWWPSCDALWRHTDQLRAILSEATSAELGLMMSPYARRRLRKLPDALTVYRGCYEHNRAGLSWTLTRSVAERFPTLSRYRQQGTPLLVTGRVAKARAVLFTDRREAEIVAPNVREIHATEIR